MQYGSARLESVDGSIDAVAGDYVVIPRGTIHRWLPGGDGATALAVAAAGHIRPPRRYLSSTGSSSNTPPTASVTCAAPSARCSPRGRTCRSWCDQAGLTRLTYARHPFDVVGWDGCLYPFALNIADFEPVVKRTHAPPPVHQTFEGPNFVICSFCPGRWTSTPRPCRSPTTTTTWTPTR